MNELIAGLIHNLEPVDVVNSLAFCDLTRESESVENISHGTLTPPERMDPEDEFSHVYVPGVVTLSTTYQSTGYSKGK